MRSPFPALFADLTEEHLRSFLEELRRARRAPMRARMTLRVADERNSGRHSSGHDWRHIEGLRRRHRSHSGDLLRLTEHAQDHVARARRRWAANSLEA